MLARFSEERAAFLKQIFRHARQAKVWWSLKLDDAMGATGAPRERIVAALNFLEEQGDLKLQVAGARQGYRLKHQPDDVTATAEKLSAGTGIEVVPGDSVGATARSRKARSALRRDSQREL